MALLILLLAVLAPRVVIVVLALTTDFFAAAYDGLLIPVLGFLLLPLTTLTYAAAVNAAGGVNGPLWTVLMIVAVLFDLGSTGWQVRRR